LIFEGGGSLSFQRNHLLKRNYLFAFLILLTGFGGLLNLVLSKDIPVEDSLSFCGGIGILRKNCLNPCSLLMPRWETGQKVIQNEGIERFQ